MQFSIQQIINDKLSAPREERKINSWHASKLGSCLTGVYLERMGVEPDEPFDARTLRVFSAGSMFESWVVDLAKNAPNVKFETQVRCELPQDNLTGYADLVCEVDGQKVLYEVKSKNSKAFWWMEKRREGANYHHRMQTWCYLKALNIAEGRILYISKDDLAVLEYPVRFDDTELACEVIKELKILNAAWAQKLPPPVPEWDGKEKWKAEYCRWHKKCVSQSKYLTI